MCLSKPKVPAPAPVIERQAYQSPVPRDSLFSSNSDANARRRAAMGVATSPLGDTSQASTTRAVFGGADINPSIGGGGGDAGTSPTSVATTPTPTPAPSTGSFIVTPKPNNKYKGLGLISQPFSSRLTIAA